MDQPSTTTRNGDAADPPVLDGISGPVLIVDDDPTDRRLLTEWVEDLGFPSSEIASVEGIDGALGFAVDRCPSVIICDWVLSGGTAGKLIRDLQQLCPPSIAVVISEHVDRTRELLAIDAGAHEIVAKTEASPLILAHALRRARLRIDADERLRIQRRIELVNRNAHIAAMSRSVVHDMKNLMMAGVANLEIMSLDLSEDDLLQPRVVDVRAAMERAGELCQDLLAYAAAAEQPRERISVEAAVGEALALVPFDARPRVAVDLSGVAEIEVHVDRFALRQVLFNLLLNAVEATAVEGDAVVSGTTVEDVTRLAGDLVVSPDTRTPLAVVEVSNGGETIDASRRDAIFDPYVSSKPGSRGLGLPSVVRAVRIMEGALSLSTGLNRTSFALAIPIEFGDSVLH